MRQTKTLPLTSVVPISAGLSPPEADHQSLLGVGPSRRYLRNHCIGAWTPAPQRPFGALTRFFPKGNGLTSDPPQADSARQTLPIMQLPPGILFRDCSSASGGFRLPSASGGLDPQVAPTAEAQSPQGSRAVYTTQWT
jgi:hypothetical protein